MRGRKRTDLINQIFIGPVLMRSRVKRGNRIVSTHLLFYFISSRKNVSNVPFPGDRLYCRDDRLHPI
ncbi:hypothetical protein B5F96_01100 [Parabacteroides johnsonii]|uniref:Uncharacterized protein n=1 Tax=Parabacteroides johnsonii TaxID=387661 RepID=A0A9Q5SU86_9BACT|nr:hypothetical protein B5F96_01100 [Parabacteroides johnsonii]